MVNEVKVAEWSLTLRRRRDVIFIGREDETKAAACAKMFLADKVGWCNDRSLMGRLGSLLDLSEQDPSRAWKIERAIEAGELVTIPDALIRSASVRQSGAERRSGPKSREAVAALPLFRRAVSAAASVSAFERPVLPRLPADDFFAIMAANPGDVLPDGSIAKALDAAPFAYLRNGPSGEALDLAASTRNEDYAAKMLGFERNEFRRVVHIMKKANLLRGDDNVTWHDNGDVYFRGEKIDNMFDF